MKNIIECVGGLVRDQAMKLGNVGSALLGGGKAFLKVGGGGTEHF